MNTNAFPEFKQLYEDHQRFVRGFLYRMLGPSLVDDAVQECFLKVWKGRDNFKGQSSLKTWIHRIATNVAIDFYRKKETTVELEERDLGTVENEDPTTSKDIEKAVLALPFEYRVVVTAVLFEEMSTKEVCDSLDLPEGTVKSRLHRGRELLKETLTNMGYGNEG